MGQLQMNANRRYLHQMLNKQRKQPVKLSRENRHFLAQLMFTESIGMYMFKNAYNRYRAIYTLIRYTLSKEVTL
jgi:hypothetical protein